MDGWVSPSVENLSKHGGGDLTCLSSGYIKWMRGKDALTNNSLEEEMLVGCVRCLCLGFAWIFFYGVTLFSPRKMLEGSEERPRTK